MIERRDFLARAAGALAACACCAPAVFAADAAKDAGAGHGAAPEAGHAPHWSYEGDAGPSHWAELQPEFKSCSLGLQQTPVDLSGGIKGEPGPLSVSYKPMPLRILNNGHTIQVNAEPGSWIDIAGTHYELVQFHFHHPSEHLLSGKSFDLEVHFVHKSAEGELAVIGVFFKPGAANSTLETIFAAMPPQEGPEIRLAASVDPSALIPPGGGYYRYMGSLTTPPCSEGLTWTVFKEPIEASPDQVRKFAALFVNNARPVQPLNRRYLISVSQ